MKVVQWYMKPKKPLPVVAKLQWWKYIELYGQRRRWLRTITSGFTTSRSCGSSGLSKCDETKYSKLWLRNKSFCWSGGGTVQNMYSLCTQLLVIVCWQNDFLRPCWSYWNSTVWFTMWNWPLKAWPKPSGNSLPGGLVWSQSNMIAKGSSGPAWSPTLFTVGLSLCYI